MMSTRFFKVLHVAGLAQTPVTISGHPRIRQRALVNLERRRRRDNLITASLAAVVAIALLSLGLARSPLLSLDTVALKGLTATQEQQVRAQIGVMEGRNILDVDLSTVARRAESLPWVDKVTLRRRLPSMLEIRVSTVRPVAVATFDQTDYLLDAEAKVLEAIAADGSATSLLVADPTALPQVSVATLPQLGQPVADAAVQSALLFAAEMPQPVRDWVRDYRVVPGGGVDAIVAVPTAAGTLDLMVHFGRPDGVRVKAAALVALTEEVLTQGIQAQALDLSIPDRPVVRT